MASLLTTALIFLTHDPTPEIHAIVVTDLKDQNSNLCFSLDLQGVTSTLPVHKPTYHNWASNDLFLIDLTDEHLDWDPGSTRFKDQEEALTNSYGDIIGKDLYDQSFVINAVGSSMTRSLVDISHGMNLGLMLESRVGVSAITGVTGTK